MGTANTHKQSDQSIIEVSNNKPSGNDENDNKQETSINKAQTTAENITEDKKVIKPKIFNLSSKALSKQHKASFQQV